MKLLLPIALATVASVFTGISSTRASSPCIMPVVSWTTLNSCLPPDQNTGSAQGSGTGDNRKLFITIPVTSSNIDGTGLLNDGITVASGVNGTCRVFNNVPGGPPVGSGIKRCNNAVKQKARVIF